MKSKILALLLLFPLLSLKGGTTPQRHASETFYVENKGSSMRVLVEGNTASGVFILFIHGGPGVGAYVYNTHYISKNLEDNYAMVYWDQRNSGGSQGNCNGRNLTFDQMLDDLGKVIRVVKKKYGENIGIFLMSHSFGGLVASGFLTEGTNQNLFRGYIDVDGSHNYPLNDTLTRAMLLTTGRKEVALNHYVGEWNRFMDYCKAHRGNFTLKESKKMEKFASQAEGYIDSVQKVYFLPVVARYFIAEKYPVTSMLVNLLYSMKSALNREIATKEFSSSLNKISIPVLILFGKFDFICPPELGTDFYSRVGSVYKRMVISPISGHNFMFQDKELFTREVNAFIEKFR